MKRLTWGTMTGLGVAGLLVAGIPAYGQGGAYGGSSSGASGQGSDTHSMGSASGSPSSGSSAATGSSMGSTASSSGTSATPTEVTGKVQTFDRQANTLKVANSDKTLKLSDDTKVMKDGQPASLSDIKEGDEVRASLSGSGDTLQVKRIDLLRSGSTGSSGAGSSSGSSLGTGSSGSSGTATPPSGSSKSDHGY